MKTRSKILIFVISFLSFNLLSDLRWFAEGKELYCIDFRACIDGVPIPWTQEILSMFLWFFISYVVTLLIVKSIDKPNDID